MTTTRRQRTATRTSLLLALAGSSVALLALGAGPAAASSASESSTMTRCANQVINDWLQHEPDVKGSYPLKCYRQAIQALEAYPDIQQYSNAPGDIHRAQLAAERQKKDGASAPGGTNGNANGGATPGGSGPGGGDDDSGGGTPAAPSGSPDPGGAGHDRSLVTRAFDAVGPGNAQSIPLPLLVLAGLAVLLLLAAAGTWIAKRLQAPGREAPLRVRK